MTFDIADNVWHSTINLQLSSHSKQFNYVCTKHSLVIKNIDKNAYILHLQSTMRNQNVFHASLLNRYTLRLAAQPPINKKKNWFPKPDPAHRHQQQFPKFWNKLWPHFLESCFWKLCWIIAMTNCNTWYVKSLCWLHVADFAHRDYSS